MPNTVTLTIIAYLTKVIFTMSNYQKKYVALLICLLLALLTCGIYLQVSKHEFINYDDQVYVTENPNVQTSLNYSSIKWAFTTNHTGYWHPITWLSIMLDYQLFHLKSAGYHLTNLILHIANILLLFAVLNIMTGTTWRSAFVVALFALHPLNVESVAWVSERKNVLSTLFWILTIAAYCRYARLSKISWYIITIILFALGLMTKPMVITLPLILLILDYWPLNRIESISINRKLFIQKKKKKIPFFILSIVAGIITVYGQKSIGALEATSKIPFAFRLANACISYIRYIGKMFCPTKLAVYYPFDTSGLPLLPAIASAALLAILTILVLRMSAKHKYLLTGWLWYIVTLLPVIGIIQAGDQAFANRYAYLPLIGLFIIIAWSAADIFDKISFPPITAFLSAIAVISALSICTYINLGYWKNDVTLFSRAIAVTKNNVRMHHTLALAYDRLGQYQNEIDTYEKVLKIWSVDSDAYYNLGVAYGKLNQHDKAAHAFENFIKINPDHPQAHYNLGLAYLNLNDINSAMEQYKILRKLDPELADKLLQEINSGKKPHTLTRQQLKLLRTEQLF